MKNGKKRIYIVEDHPIMRDGIIRLIDLEAGMEVCGSAGSCTRALEGIEKAEADMVIVDLSLNDRNGIDLIKDLKARFMDLPVLVLSMHHEDYFAQRALRAGARGYVMKSETGETVRKAIREVSRNRLFISDKIKNKMIDQMINGNSGSVVAGTPLIERLSDREFEVFRYLSEGYKPAEIAEKLNLSIKTIDTYRSRMKEKLGLNSFSELTRQAILWMNINP